MFRPQFLVIFRELMIFSMCMQIMCQLIWEQFTYFIQIIIKIEILKSLKPVFFNIKLVYTT